MIALLAVDVAHWHGPLGGIVAWLFRNTPGNLAASAMCFIAGFAVARRHFKKHVDRLVKRLDHIIVHHPDIPKMESDG